MSTPEQAVENGAQLLTRHYGSDSWVKRVNLADLDIRSGTDCVLGQLMYHYYFSEACSMLGVPAGLDHRYGFDIADGIPVSRHRDAYAELNQAWKSYVRRALAARRARSESVAPSIVRTRACVSDDTRTREMAGV